MLIAGLSSVFFVHAAAAAGSPSQIAIVSGNNQASIVGQTLPSAFVVKVTDSNGNAVSGATVAWKIMIGAGHFPTGSTVTNSSGVTSNTMTLGTATSWNQAAATTSAGAAVILGANGQAGHAKTIALYSGNQQTGTVGSLLPSNLEVICRDQYGNTSAMAQIAWAATSGGGSFSYFQSATVKGIAVKSLTLGKTPGVNTATATIEGTSTSYTFTETAVVGPPAIMSITSGNYQHGRARRPSCQPVLCARHRHIRKSVERHSGRLESPYRRRQLFHIVHDNQFAGVGRTHSDDGAGVRST